MAEPQCVDGTSGLSSAAVVVTEEMIISAASTGDLESLTIWAKQGVRVTSAAPLYVAARGGYSSVVRLLVQQMGANVGHASHRATPLIVAVATRNANPALVQCLVVELGASINQAMQIDGRTLLTLAAIWGHLPMVRCLIHLGARIEVVDNYGNTALLRSALYGRYATM
jgi:hypothetical protein